MIPYSRDPAKTIPPTSVKIIGLGGAGANMLERIALDGMEGTELLALNTDIRNLGACIAGEKIQLGANLTKGLGAGGDPQLGNKAVLEAENEVRTALKDHKIVFVCAGLGGGTGSGAAPIVTRIAREEGAFVVVFATTPFAFEGDRRRDQAEAALNELAVLSNALVTFDNNRMGELVLAKQGIHEAFGATDQMISESIKSVIRLVVRPGLINIGLDELMTALKTNRSRCLFGSGMAEGADRASKALRSALASPLLDEGSLLKDTQSVLVHLCGGEDLTLFEVELLMQQLSKHVPEKAQVLFGAAIDPALGNSLSVTLISALPEEALAKAPRKAISQADDDSPLVKKTASQTKSEPKANPKPEPALQAEAPRKEPVSEAPSLFEQEKPFAEPESHGDSAEEKNVSPLPEKRPEGAAPWSQKNDPAKELTPLPPEGEKQALNSKPTAAELLARFGEEENESEDEPTAETNPPEPMTSSLPVAKSEPISGSATQPEDKPAAIISPFKAEPLAPKPDKDDAAIPKLKLGVKPAASGSGSDELSLDSSPRGRFEGEDPNVVDGEDLDLPPFLRKKK